MISIDSQRHQQQQNRSFGRFFRPTYLILFLIFLVVGGAWFIFAYHAFAIDGRQQERQVESHAAQPIVVSTPTISPDSSSRYTQQKENDDVPNEEEEMISTTHRKKMDDSSFDNNNYIYDNNKIDSNNNNNNYNNYNYNSNSNNDNMVEIDNYLHVHDTPPDPSYLYIIVEYPYPWKILDLLQEEKGDKEAWLGGRRKEEFEEALVRNLHHPAVREMHVMWEDAEGWRALQRIQAVHDINHRMRVPTAEDKPQGEGRMRYQDALMYARQHLPWDAPVLVMNADLYLGSHGEWTGRMRPGEDGDRLLRPDDGEGGRRRPKVYALSRFGNEGCPFDKDTCRRRRNTGSHDGFMFVNPVPADMPERLAHPQNIPGAENVVVYEFLRAGYTARNPCGVLPLVHNHCTAYRRYAAKRMNSKGRSRSARPEFDFPTGGRT